MNLAVLRLAVTPSVERSESGSESQCGELFGGGVSLAMLRLAMTPSDLKCSGRSESGYAKISRALSVVRFWEK